MTTWGAVHVGDTVRGADQRGWTVTGARPGGTWLGSGRTDVLLALQLGERRVDVRRGVGEPVELVERADHSGEAAACLALLGAGITFDLLEETLSADPFAAPTSAPVKVKHDRFGRYLLPDPETGKERAWTRATTIARTLADEYHLTRWKLRQVARGMALRPDLVAGAAAADPEEDKGTLDDIAEKAMERAGSSTGSTLGTALHNFTKRYDRGEPAASLGVPPPLVPDMAAYVDTLKRHRLKVRPETVERIVVVPELGVAGQLDRIAGQPSGVTKSKPLAILDLKTAKTTEYSGLENAIQLAIYAHAALMWDPARQAYEPMPDVDRERALLLHLPVGKAHGSLHGVNLIEGWEYALLAMNVRAARNAGKGLTWLVEPEPADLALHRVAHAPDRGELARLWEQLYPQGLWTEEVNAAATERLAELQAVPA